MLGLGGKKMNQKNGMCGRPQQDLKDRKVLKYFRGLKFWKGNFLIPNNWYKIKKPQLGVKV